MIISRRLMVSVLAGCVLVLSEGVYAQTDPITGTWSLNVSKSDLPAGQAPRSQTITYQGTGDNKTATTETVDTQGKQARATFIHIYDGQPHATAGSPDTDASAYTRLNPNTVIFTRMKSGKLAGVGNIVVSSDGKTLTVSGTGASGVGGLPATYAAVYDKR